MFSEWIQKVYKYVFAIQLDKSENFRCLFGYKQVIKREIILHMKTRPNRLRGDFLHGWTRLEILEKY